jgi:uncharacterized protein (DUF885 family)
MMRWIVAVLLTGACAAAHAQDADARFRALWERDWQWRLEQSPLLASSVGDARGATKLDRVDPKSQRARLPHWRALRAELDGIERAQLSPAQQVNRDILSEQIDSAIANIELDGYLMPLNGDSSFYADLAFIARAGVFRDERAYRDYLARLHEIPRYFADNLALLEQGRKRGMVLPRIVLQGRDAAARKLGEGKVEDSPYYAPFKTMPTSMAAERADALRGEARSVLQTRVFPAYRMVADYLAETYIPKARRDIAAYALPNGKAYYRQQIRDFTTLDLEPQAIHDTGLREVARIRADMEQVIATLKFDGDFAAFLKFLRTDPQFYAKTPEELLMRAAWIAKRVDAKTPQYFGTLPRLPFGIEPVPAAIAPYYTGGRYSPPGEGSGQPGFYWVNTYRLDSRPLYVLPALTLHESVPGHHLQGALAGEAGEQPPFRRYTYISAYGEGWALYTEYLGKEMGIYETPYEEFGRLTYEMWRACRLVVDTGMHAFGWSRDKALTYLRENTALSEHETETEIDRYIGWPGQALSYKLGELKIRELRARAEQRLGARFDLRAFHDVVLAQGSVPLHTLEAQVEAYLATAAAQPAAP